MACSVHCNAYTMAHNNDTEGSNQGGILHRFSYSQSDSRFKNATHLATNSACFLT